MTHDDGPIGEHRCDGAASSSAQARTPQIPQITLKPRTKPPAFIVTSCGGECIDYNRSGDLFGAGESSTRGIFRTRFDWDKDANLPTDLYHQESRFGFQIHTLPRGRRKFDAWNFPHEVRFEARSTLLKALRLARTPCKVARLGSAMQQRPKRIGRPPNTWKLFVRNSTMFPPVTVISEHQSKRAALERAYSLPPNHTALRIEGPKGERINRDAIES